VTETYVHAKTNHTYFEFKRSEIKGYKDKRLHHILS